MSDRQVSGLGGVVLAGGQSRRMGQDKGSLNYHGIPQVHHAFWLLTELVEPVYVSVSTQQAGQSIYGELPLLIDDESTAGPAAGLLEFWSRFPAAAALLLAVDLPFVDATLLAQLVRGRDPQCQATVFRHPDETLEPLCAIWEPSARSLVLKAAEEGPPSLRRLLAQMTVKVLLPERPDTLKNVNTPQESARTRQAIEQRERGR